MDVNNLCLLFGPNVVKPPPCVSTGQQTCESLTTTSMQQVVLFSVTGSLPSGGERLLNFFREMVTTFQIFSSGMFPLLLIKFAW
jgi:hypothetical protein